MNRVITIAVCLSSIPLSQCVKKMGSQAIGNVYSCSVKKGETNQVCTEFKNLTANEIAHFKLKCDSDSSMDAASWQDKGCTQEARQGGCELNYTDSGSNISTSFVAWGYTATALAAITSPAACENSGGKIIQP